MDLPIIAGTLPQPVCGYATEQERLEAFAASLTALLEGGIQWETGLTAPSDLTKYWLKTDGDGRPVAILKWSLADGEWLRPLNVPAADGAPGGLANAYTLVFDPPFTAATAYANGRTYILRVSATNTGASTFEVDGLTAVDLVKGASTALVAGEAVVGSVLTIVMMDGDAHVVGGLTAIPPSLPRYAVTAEFDPPAAAASLPVPHSLTIVPYHVDLVAVCKIAINGYSVNDEIDAWGIMADISGGAEDCSAYSVTRTATNLTISAQTATNGQNYCAKAGGNADWDVAVAAGSWKLKAYLSGPPA